MNLTTFAVKCIFLMYFLLLATGARAQDLAAAKILKTEGAVQITRPSTDGKTMNRVNFQTNDSVFTGDVIKTNTGARFVLKLADGSQAIIGENTIVEIKDATNSPRTIFNVLRGRTRIKIEKLGGKPNPYRVTTPTTVIAVRGTIFDVFVKGDKTEVFVLEGQVSVINLHVPEQEIFLVPGQFTHVEKQRAPQPPTSFKPRRNDEFFKPVEGGGGHGRNSGDHQNNPDRTNPRRDNPPPPRQRPDDFPNLPRGTPPNNFPGNNERGNPPRKPLLKK